MKSKHKKTRKANRPAVAPAAAPQAFTAGEIEARLAAAARAKAAAGKIPTVAELAALKREEREAEKNLRWNCYRSVAQIDYAALSGRAPKILKDQHQIYGIPCGEAVVDLSKVLRAFHDLLAKHGRQINAPESDAEDKLDAVRVEIARREKRENDIAEGLLIPIGEVEAIVGTCAARLVRVLGILENNFATEFALWLVDPKVAALSSDDRARLIREFVSKTAADVRRQEADGVQKLIDEVADEK